MRRLAPELTVLVVVGALALRGLLPGAPLAPDALWSWARSEAGGDLGADPYLDAAEACARLRPWQAGFWECRDRLTEVDRERRR